MKGSSAIVRTILEHYAATQAIYLFGTHGTEDEQPGSDVDIAVLLPFEAAERQPRLGMTACQTALVEELGKDVDLVNLRKVSTVFQKVIIETGRRLHCADETAAAEFEMLTLSLYQKLNEERKAILEAFHETGKAYGA